MPISKDSVRIANNSWTNYGTTIISYIKLYCRCRQPSLLYNARPSSASGPTSSISNPNFKGPKPKISFRDKFNGNR